MKKKKILMTGGGTGGHVIPNIALIPTLIKEGYDVFYVGSKGGIEKRLIGELGINYYSISSGKLRRYFDVKNFTDPFKVLKGFFDSVSIIRKEKPDIVFSKGGFVAVPVVIAASIKKIPVIAHESDITPGLANRISQKYIDKLCVTFPESLKHVDKDKAVLTGSPIRQELFDGDRNRAKDFIGIKNNKETLLIMGGSLGSSIINTNIREALDELLKNFNIIHLVGDGNLDPSIKREGYYQFEYMDSELKDCFALSDYIITRGGSNTIFEVLALKKPNIIIPLSRQASRGDQILNANSFQNSGYSKVIEEEDLTPEILIKNLEELKRDKIKFINNMSNSKVNDGVKNIVNIIKENIK